MNFRKALSRDVTVGTLLAVMIVTHFVVVLPSLMALQAIPQHYFNLLPVSVGAADMDRDGVPDGIDATPYGARVVHASAPEA